MKDVRKRSLFYKFFSLLSVVRGYNILILVIAQYLVSIYIFSPKKSITTVVFDLHLSFVVLSTVCVVAGGYIINNFYDVKADKINRPIKSGLDNYVKQETKLSIYFVLNFIGVLANLIINIQETIIKYFRINLIYQKVDHLQLT